jgi:tRNA(Ile)-lysidine synthase
MKEEFLKFLVSSCGCSTANKYLLAVSGGIDSVVMAHLFQSAGIQFSIAHCNFQLREKDSEADEEFVKALAGKFNVPFFAKKFDTTHYSDELGISIQMAARDLRYNWFYEIALENNLDYIVIGHNKNDIIETVLMNFTRGTGIRGLMGIKPVNNKIIRPLLFATRQLIQQYAENNNLKWREDASNAEIKYQRNKIRHTIIPAFESINPSFIQNAQDTIKRIEQSGKLLDFIVKQIKDVVWNEFPDRILINLEKLREYPANDIILHELLKDFGISQLSGAMVTNIMESDTGKQFHTRTHTFSHDRKFLIICPKKTVIETTEIAIDAETILLNYPIRLYFSTVEKYDGFRIPVDKNIAVLDFDKILFPLFLRRWKTGDRFYPLGLNGSKKVSDFLINIKLPLPDKKYIWIIESAGEIVWLVNLRIDDRYKVTEGTRKILIIENK